MLHENEKILFQGKPEKSILILWSFTKCLAYSLNLGVLVLFGCFIFGVIYNVLILRSPGNPSWFIFMIPVLLVVLLSSFLISLLYCVALRKTYNYYVTNERCIFTGGILIKRERSVFFHKITDTEIYQNIIERLLKIYRLNIFTPGTASMLPSGKQIPEISFMGLKDVRTPTEVITNILKTYRSTGE